MDDRDPMGLFRRWFDEAAAAEPDVPEAASLATVDETGAPSVRMVLWKGQTTGAFDFYTNYGSTKGRHLARNPRAALCFHWKSLQRQVRVQGDVHQLPVEVSDAYFATRDRVSQLGAWASRQSEPIDSPEELVVAFARIEARLTGDVHRPAFWGGYRLEPTRIEFWQGRPARLHERREFLKASDGWVARWLQP